jgi:crossover junction endodeoxyribonuclease RuvC
LAERLVAIFRGLREIMDRFPPSAAAVETVFAGKNPRTALAIGEGRGVALLAAAERGVEVFGYEPALIKRAVTGSGRADKDQVRRMVRILLGLPEPPETDHAADALALAITHTRHLDGNGWLGRTAREPAGRGRLPEAILRQLPSVAASGRGDRGRV